MTWVSSLSLILASGPVGPGRPIFEFFTPIMEMKNSVDKHIET